MRDLYHLPQPDGRKLVLAPALLQTFDAHRQQPRSRSHESGGILLGRLYADRVLVERATTPGPGDKSGPHFFHRCAARAQGFVDEAWRESGGEVNYLGEWHSHPEARPTPSRRDRAMIHEVFWGAQVEAGPLLLIIVGSRENWVGVEDGQTLQVLG